MADETYKSVKMAAFERNPTVKQLVLDGLDFLMLHRAPKPPTKRLQLPLIRSTRTDKLDIDSEQIVEIIEFPDVNVRQARNCQMHPHNSAAVRWYESLAPSTVLIFCRNTQLGLFRLLSTESVMKQDAMNQPQCWDVFDRWIASVQAYLAQEPLGLESGCGREPQPNPLRRRPGQMRICRICGIFPSRSGHLRPGAGREDERGGAAGVTTWTSRKFILKSAINMVHSLYAHDA
jgi:hypothetical protein